MAKTIKFNLIMDGEPVRNLEGLQENFSIEDIWNYYKSGLLARWLEVRGYEKQLEAVKGLAADMNRKEAICRLAAIFEMAPEGQVIDRETGILDYEEKKQRMLAEYKKNSFDQKRVIEEYHAGYEALIDRIVANKESMGAIKADIHEMEKEYFRLFIHNPVRLCARLAQEAPRAIYAMLMRDAFRDYMIGEKSVDVIKRNIMTNFIGSDDLKNNLGDDLKCVKRNTQAMWDPIERPEVGVMVLSVTHGAFVKNAGNFSEKLGHPETYGKFLLLKGLEYQCNNETYELLYVEV